MEVIAFSRTFARTTPESIDAGDFSETGFLEKGKCSFRELMDMLEEHTEASTYPLRESSLQHTWFSDGFNVVCYTTGTEQENSLHIGQDAVSQRALRRALKLLGRIQ